VVGAGFFFNAMSWISNTSRVIVALDFAGGAEALDFLGRFPEGERPFVKVGMELFYSAGPEIVRAMKERGHKVFLDLKLHDIPNTVGRAAAALRDLGADIVNVHAAGGAAMMRAALDGLKHPDGSRPLVIAVTQLTSTSPEMLKDELLVGAPMEETVLRYARNAWSAGLDGVVCSPLEAAAVKARCGAGFLTVTPGVRFADSSADDQRRVMTPEAAFAAGSDFIVMGRPITRAADPVAAWRRACQAAGEGQGPAGRG
jgi:orotidine-5'-phosphate decarboxylase